MSSNTYFSVGTTAGSMSAVMPVTPDGYESTSSTTITISATPTSSSIASDLTSISASSSYDGDSITIDATSTTASALSTSDNSCIGNHRAEDLCTLFSTAPASSLYTTLLSSTSSTAPITAASTTLNTFTTSTTSLSTSSSSRSSTPSQVPVVQQSPQNHNQHFNVILYCLVFVVPFVFLMSFLLFRKACPEAYDKTAPYCPIRITYRYFQPKISAMMETRRNNKAIRARKKARYDVDKAAEAFRARLSGSVGRKSDDSYTYTTRTTVRTNSAVDDKEMSQRNMRHTSYPFPHRVASRNISSDEEKVGDTKNDRNVPSHVRFAQDVTDSFSPDSLENYTRTEPHSFIKHGPERQETPPLPPSRATGLSTHSKSSPAITTISSSRSDNNEDKKKPYTSRSTTFNTYRTLSDFFETSSTSSDDNSITKANDPYHKRIAAMKEERRQRGELLKQRTLESIRDHAQKQVGDQSVPQSKSESSDITNAPISSALKEARPLQQNYILNPQLHGHSNRLQFSKSAGQLHGSRPVAQTFEQSDMHTHTRADVRNKHNLDYNYNNNSTPNTLIQPTNQPSLTPPSHRYHHDPLSSPSNPRPNRRTAGTISMNDDNDFEKWWDNLDKVN